MKKLLAIVLSLVMVLGLAACGAINETDVAVLWSGDGIVHVPDSLINALERAMYIENISYAHYGANGDQAAQTAKAQELLNGNCAGLVVELVDASAAQTIVDMATAKNVPVVFLNCEVDAAVVKSYAKCVSVNSDDASVTTVLGDKIAESIADAKKYAAADLDGDGVIRYLALGEVSKIADAVNAKLADAKLAAIAPVDAASVAELKVTTVTEKKTEYGRLSDKNGAVVEMILSDNDVAMLDQLVALQSNDFNANMLKTHFVPVYTVGADADYKAYVFSKIPAVGAAFADSKLDKTSAIPEEVIEQIRGYSNLLKLATMEKWDDLEKAVYTTRNVVGDGRLTNAAAEDLDGLAGAAAAAMAQLLKGNTTENIVAVSYITVK